MNCDNCEKKHEPVSWEAFQSTAARANFANRRWFFAWLITFVLLVGVVVFLFWQTTQYEQVTTEYTQEIDTGEGDFTDNYVINRGGIYYGEGETDGSDQEVHP